MVHFILFSTVLITIICSKINHKLLPIPFLVLFIFSSLRYMFGNDYARYFSVYHNIQSGGRSPYDEILFTLLNKFSPNFYLMIVLISFAFICAVYLLIKYNLPTEYYWLGVLIFLINPYLFLMNLSSLRQSLAIVFFIFAVHFAIKRNILAFLVFVGIALLFHKSAVLLLPMYFVCGERKIKKWFVAVILIAVVSILFLPGFQDLITYIATCINDKDYIYFAQQNMQNSLRATLLTSVFFIYVLFNLPRLKGKALVYSKLYLIGTVLGVLAIKMSMLTRFQMYFDIFSVVSIPLIMEQNYNKGPIKINRDNVVVTVWDCVNKYVMPILIFLIYILRYYSFFSNQLWSSFANYHTIFEVI